MSEPIAVEENLDEGSMPEPRNFICGVVEGFYGRPWTTEQRKDLFVKLKKWGMDSYLYAPKDDYKHRAFWRDLYSVEEAEHLTGLISAAKQQGIDFYYALSPGLDITYSSSKEVSTLKRKLEQVAQFGCRGFALLFDDIESEMSESDKEVFQSFAHAQVSVTNEIFEHLGQPKFMLCPTQYCSTRALPNVKNSEYLNTLGAKLAQEIDIMWTGPKVISRLLTLENIEDITEVLRRPPIIWDNIHANDYDQKRIFLGPYQGRSPDIIPKIRGVLTNPNCEYGANFIAIHTLAQWSKCSGDIKPELNESISADIKLETESEDGTLSEDYASSLPPNMYHPRRALRNAIAEWLPEFQKPKASYGPIVKPQVGLPPTAILPPVPVTLIPSVNTCMILTSTTSTVTMTSTATAHSNGTSTDSTMSSLTPTTSSGGVGIIMNSLISETKVLSEPMDCIPVGGLSPTAQTPPPSENKTNAPQTGPGGQEEMQVEDSDTTATVTGGSHGDKLDKDKELTCADLSLMCDLFYLPFEHGSQGLFLLTEFNWLKSNSHLVSASRLAKDKSLADQNPEVTEWFERANKLDEFSQNLNRLFVRLTYCNNRELLYELYPYVWDMRGVVSLLNSYVKWLASGHYQESRRCSTTQPPSSDELGSVPGGLNPTLFLGGAYTWFSKGWKETFMSGDQEPWVFRGGLTADLQRLIPVDASTDLFAYKPPTEPTSQIYTIRPYFNEDEQGVYNVCRRTCLDTQDGTEVFPDLPNLAPDRLVGAFLTLSPELCMVCEDNEGLAGYALAARDAKTFYSRLQLAYLPEMCDKYPSSSGGSQGGIVNEMITWFHEFKGDQIPSTLEDQHPSLMVMSILPRVSDLSIPKRLVTCLLAALRSNGKKEPATLRLQND
uniref:protein O-GlcNAcase n=1 Tax=Cacopsylla melanoneura TaxID=428564 RepID=A0A8D8WXM0_9HEMI